MNLVLKVIGLDLALCFCQLVTPRLLCGVGNIGYDYEPLHGVVEAYAVRGGLHDGG